MMMLITKSHNPKKYELNGAPTDEENKKTKQIRQDKTCE
jgi:hypothetical protein